MTIGEALISGVIQGLAEFLPISSSGHLVLLHEFLGIEGPQLFFDVLLHLGTLVVVVITFRKELQETAWNQNGWLLPLAVGTLPIVVVGAVAGRQIEAFFSQPRVVAVALGVTAAWLVAGTWANTARAGRRAELGWRVALVIGVAQAAALVPGISRSGATICTGLLCGLSGAQAVAFAFLLAVPATLAAVVWQLWHSGGIGGQPLGMMVVGAVVASVVGWYALHWLIGVVQRHRLSGFAWYCGGLATVVWVFGA